MTNGRYRLSRVAAGLSQTEMAQALDVSQPTLSRFENGLADLAPAKVERFLAICAARAPIVPHELFAAGEQPT